MLRFEKNWYSDSSSIRACTFRFAQHRHFAALFALRPSMRIEKPIKVNFSRHSTIHDRDEFIEPNNARQGSTRSRLCFSYFAGRSIPFVGEFGLPRSSRIFKKIRGVRGDQTTEERLVSHGRLASYRGCLATSRSTLSPLLSSPLYLSTPFWNEKAHSLAREIKR